MTELERLNRERAEALRKFRDREATSVETLEVLRTLDAAIKKAKRKERSV